MYLGDLHDPFELMVGVAKAAAGASYDTLIAAIGDVTDPGDLAFLLAAAFCASTTIREYAMLGADHIVLEAPWVLPEGLNMTLFSLFGHCWVRTLALIDRDDINPNYAAFVDTTLKGYRAQCAGQADLWAADLEGENRGRLSDERIDALRKHIGLGVPPETVNAKMRETLARVNVCTYTGRWAELPAAEPLDDDQRQAAEAAAEQETRNRAARAQEARRRRLARFSGSSLN